MRNNLKKYSKVAVVLILLFELTFSTQSIDIIERGRNFIITEIAIDSVFMNNKQAGDETFQTVSANGFSALHRTGYPLLIYRGIHIATESSRSISITILEQDYKDIENCNIYPSPEITPAEAGADCGDIFTKNDSVYNVNRFYPQKIVQVMNTQIYKNIPISTIGFMPIQYNPVTKTLRTYKKLRIKITYSSISESRKTSLSGNSLYLISNIIENPYALPINSKRNGPDSDFGKDIVIFTINTYKAAAETLAVWQRMKGYDVEIKYKDVWNAADVDLATKSFYSNTTPKPGYILIIGDGPDVKPDTSKAGKNMDVFATDTYFACMDGSDDYTPEMARGRISVSNATEAMVVVRKIIDYEKNPPKNDSFYQNVLGASYFQDNYNIFTKDGDGVEDRAFVETVENALLHLSDKSYDITRVYNYGAADHPGLVLPTEPAYWSIQPYNTQGALPDYLKNTATWQGKTEDILNRINDGCFLVFHYDHGNTDGWSYPSFKLDNVNSLTNANQLPLVYSIDCHVGRFYINKYEQIVNVLCFAEKILRKENGGAIGIVAASRTSASGPNDALHYGLIDATWPGLIHHSGKYPNPTVTTHEPVYIVGDILNQGLFRMSETWPDFGLWIDQNIGIKAHYEMYYYFGDPTTRLWTDIPKTITINMPDTIAKNASGFPLKKVNALGGMATLFDRKSGSIVGKCIIKNSNFEIPVVNSLSSIGDMVTLTITGQNLKTYIKDVIIGDKTGNVAVVKNDLTIGKLTLEIHNSKLIFRTISGNTAIIKIFDTRGRVVYNRVISSSNNKTVENSIDLDKSGYSRGAYFVTINTMGKKYLQKIIY